MQEDDIPLWRLQKRKRPCRIISFHQRHSVAVFLLAVFLGGGALSLSASAEKREGDTQNADTFLQQSLRLEYLQQDAKRVRFSPLEEEASLAERQSRQAYEQKLAGLLQGYPLQHMVPFLAQQEDARVVAFLVGIAKKESNWGRRAPADAKGDCYNYWGYSGAGSRGKVLGLGCFATPEEAVEVVGRRIATFVKQGRTTPAKMVVWKCGYTCKGHTPASVEKWIRDVSLYFHKALYLREKNPSLLSLQ